MDGVLSMKFVYLLSFSVLITLGLAKGQTWEPIRPPGTYTYYSFTVDAAGVITLIGDGGTYWSVDQGRKWTGESPSQFTKSTVVFNYNGKSAQAAGSVHLSGGQDFVAAANGDLYCVATNAGTLAVYRSSDHGFTWNNTMDSLPELATVRLGTSETLLCVPDGTLYMFIPNAGNTGRDLFTSTDQGKTWQKKNGLKLIDACVADSASQVYCTGNQTGSFLSVNLFKSTDTGSTWTDIDTNSLILATANQPDRIARVGFHQLDAKFPGDATFRIATLGFEVPNGSDLVIMPTDEILVGTSKGIARVNKGLDAYQNMNAGLKNDSLITSCKFQYDLQGNLYLRANAGLYVMRNSNSSIRPILQSHNRTSLQNLFDLNGRKVTEDPARSPSRLGLIGVYRHSQF